MIPAYKPWNIGAFVPAASGGDGGSTGIGVVSEAVSIALSSDKPFVDVAKNIGEISQKVVGTFVDSSSENSEGLTSCVYEVSRFSSRRFPVWALVAVAVTVLALSVFYVLRAYFRNKGHVLVKKISEKETLPLLVVEKPVVKTDVNLMRQRSCVAAIRRSHLPFISLFFRTLVDQEQKKELVPFKSGSCSLFSRFRVCITPLSGSVDPVSLDTRNVSFTSDRRVERREGVAFVLDQTLSDELNSQSRFPSEGSSPVVLQSSQLNNRDTGAGPLNDESSNENGGASTSGFRASQEPEPASAIQPPPVIPIVSPLPRSVELFPVDPRQVSSNDQESILNQNLPPSASAELDSQNRSGSRSGSSSRGSSPVVLQSNNRDTGQGLLDDESGNQNGGAPTSGFRASQEPEPASAIQPPPVIPIVSPLPRSVELFPVDPRQVSSNAQESILNQNLPPSASAELDSQNRSGSRSRSSSRGSSPVVSQSNNRDTGQGLLDDESGNQNGRTPTSDFLSWLSNWSEPKLASAIQPPPGIPSVSLLSRSEEPFPIDNRRIFPNDEESSVKPSLPPSALEESHSQNRSGSRSGSSLDGNSSAVSQSSQSNNRETGLGPLNGENGQAPTSELFSRQVSASRSAIQPPPKNPSRSSSSSSRERGSGDGTDEDVPAQSDARSRSRAEAAGPQERSRSQSSDQLATSPAQFLEDQDAASAGAKPVQRPSKTHQQRVKRSQTPPLKIDWTGVQAKYMKTEMGKDSHVMEGYVSQRQIAFAITDGRLVNRETQHLYALIGAEMRGKFSATREKSEWWVPIAKADAVVASARIEDQRRREAFAENLRRFQDLSQQVSNPPVKTHSKSAQNVK